MWAEASDERGAKSYPTENLTVTVKQPKLFRVGALPPIIGAIFVSLLVLILILLLAVFYVWRRLAALRKLLGREAGDIEKSLHKVLNALRQSIKEQIIILEKTRRRRGLTIEEERLILQLKKSLDNVERAVIREVRDIEKEIE